MSAQIMEREVLTVRIEFQGPRQNRSLLNHYTGQCACQCIVIVWCPLLLDSGCNFLCKQEQEKRVNLSRVLNDIAGLSGVDKELSIREVLTSSKKSRNDFTDLPKCWQWSVLPKHSAQSILKFCLNILVRIFNESVEGKESSKQNFFFICHQFYQN